MSRLRRINEETPSDAEVRQQVEQLSFPIDGNIMEEDNESVGSVFSEWEKQHMYQQSDTGEIIQIQRKPIKHTIEIDTFTCNVDVNGCPVAPKDVEILVPYQMFNQWIFLTKEFDTEWFAFLKGEKKEDGSYEFTDMYFPPQKAQGAHVSVEDGHILEGTLGAIHSHVNMNASFSAEDKQHANHEVEIVINRKGDYEASVRIQLECGRYQRTSGKIILSNCTEELALASQLEAQITIESSSPQRQSNMLIPNTSIPNYVKKQ
jgi:hypothetical protein